MTNDATTARCTAPMILADGTVVECAGVFNEAGECITSYAHAKGLPCSVYRDASGSDCSLNGVSARFARVTLIGVAIDREGGGVFEPTDMAPAVVLTQSAGMRPSAPHARPWEVRGKWAMMGGAYIATSDSRFVRATGVHGAIRLHDRVEN